MFTLPEGEASRPFWKRMTIIWSAIFAGVSAAEATGSIPAGTGEAGANLLQTLAGFLATIGIYRQVSK